MKKIYVAAPGRTIPTGWPEDGRPINPLSSYERVLVKDGDLVEFVKPKSPKKDDVNGQ